MINDNKNVVLLKIMTFKIQLVSSRTRKYNYIGLYSYTFILYIYIIAFLGHILITTFRTFVK